MAEFDPVTPKDDIEAAYARSLLGDDAGREQRRARLMAALPRPQQADVAPVAEASLAWRWRPYAFGALVAGLLLAAILGWRALPSPSRPQADPRLAAGAPASAATVVAQAEPAAEAPPAAVKPSPPRSHAAKATPVVVADATRPPPLAEREARAAAPVAEPAEPVVATAPVEAAAPAAPPMAVAEATVPSASVPALALSGGAATRARLAPKVAQALAASDAAHAQPAHAALLAAVSRADAAGAAMALQAGASVHGRDAQGRTALMLAARAGSRDMVELLLAAGARKADRDPHGWTAADHAEAEAHTELAALLR